MAIAEAPRRILTTGDMTPENIERLFMWVKEQLDAMDVRIDSVGESIVDHESRIATLESA